MHVGDESVLLSQIISKHILACLVHIISDIGFPVYPFSLFFNSLHFCIQGNYFFSNYGYRLWYSCGVIYRPFKMNHCGLYYCICIGSLCPTYHLSDLRSAVFLTLYHEFKLRSVFVVIDWVGYCWVGVDLLLVKLYVKSESYCSICNFNFLLQMVDSEFVNTPIQF